MKNGEVRTQQGIKIEAVPAYNIVTCAAEGVPFDAKGSGNGYVVTLGGKRIYVTGAPRTSRRCWILAPLITFSR